MNSNKEDIGVLKDYTLDLAFGSAENDFECTVSANNNVCKSRYYLYYEGSEYGGIIDYVYVDTESETVIYKGRTWHGMIESHILQPDVGADYLTVSGEANSVLTSLITRMGIGALFKVSEEDSGINISTYNMNRYVGGYTGIRKMLKKSGAKLEVAFREGFVELSASPLIDYSQDEQFDTDQISFSIQKNYKHVNHVICLGQGDLKDRRVIHVYADALGNISGIQTLTGLDEVCVIYDNSNAESDDELKQGGFDIIADSWASDSIDFNFSSNDESFDINDVIGAKELTTDTIVTASITKKIVKIVKNTTTISYECEGNSGTISSGSYPSSGTGGTSLTIDDALSETSTNPVQNKVVTNSLKNKLPTYWDINNGYIPELEVTPNTTLEQLCQKIILDVINNGKQAVIVNYWINAGTQIGKDVRTQIGDEYGNLEIIYANATIYGTFRSYENRSVWEMTYTYVNNVGFGLGWKKMITHQDFNDVISKIISGDIVPSTARSIDSGDGKLIAWVDAEGGNIEIGAGNGHTNYWQFDSYNGNLRVYTFRESDGQYMGFEQTQDGIFYTSQQGLLLGANGIHVQPVSVSANSYPTAISAPQISGFAFKCWLGVASIGFLGSPYIEDMLASSTNIFDLHRNAEKTYTAWALYLRVSY